MIDKLVKYIREIYSVKESFLPLHEPRFLGNEKKYLNECIDSTFVSSVGKFVDKFEAMICEITGAKYAVATSNGTSALHIGLVLADVKQNDLVITQALTFVATVNALKYTGATPVFVDVDKDTMGLSPKSLLEFLKENTSFIDGKCIHNNTKKQIKACVPMHTFGHACRIDEIVEICNKYNIKVVEDSAESLGTTYKNKHTGTFGDMGVYSFNGNKTITCGGGGVLVTNDEALAKRAKHITTTAKVPHKWEYDHDEVGYNYRMPNINAALACAQLEQLDGFINNKRELSGLYKTFFEGQENIEFRIAPKDSDSNYWLQAVCLEDKQARDEFLDKTNAEGIMTRPIWTLMNKVKMIGEFIQGDLSNSEWLEDRIVNITSSVRI
ncbi:MAG: LegC family aminotransferase [Flavobacteriaceae bacterium]|nr:LegC family aminotransferase [Flavobacteriaceae bacterium]